MTQIRLRSDLTAPLSFSQADDNLRHLALVQEISGDTQMHAGGRYTLSGSATLTLPTDGNVFQLKVDSGEATLSGETVDGVSDLAIGPGPMRTYWRTGGQWRLQSGLSSDQYVFSTGGKTLNFDELRLWVKTPADSILTCPAGAADDTVFDIVRQGPGNLRFQPSGGEGVINPATGTSDTGGLDINKPGRVLLRKEGNDWVLIP